MLGLDRVECKWIPEPAQGDVFYDLEVEDTHCYIANRVLVSNSHIKLAEPMPNPVLEKGIRSLTGLSSSEFDGIMQGSLAVDKDGKLVSSEDASAKYFGGKAIHFLLARIDRDKELDELMNQVADLRGSKLDAVIKKVKILRALKQANLQPTDFMRTTLPVIPPIFRPYTVTGKGDLIMGGLTELYKGIAVDNETLASLPPDMPEQEKAEIRYELYDGLKSLAGLGGSLNSNPELSGVLGMIHGSELKHGFFQKNLLKARQDLSARGVITPDLDIGIEEIGMPKEVAKVLYEPFVIGKLTALPYSMKPAEAKEALKNETEVAMRVLESEMAARPVAMKRDPMLHKHSILGFKPVIVPGKSFHLNPLVTTGFNADFDGDAMSVFVPLTAEAVEEVKGMMASRVLRSPTSGGLMFVPKLESLHGLFLLTNPGKKTNKKFPSEEAILHAYKNDEIAQDDVVSLNGKPTTAGRVVLAGVLPKDEIRAKVLHDMEFVITSKTLPKMLEHYAKQPDTYVRVVDRMKDLGYINATARGFTIGLKDLRVLKNLRDEVLAKADIEASHIPLDAKDRNAKLTAIYSRAMDELKEKIDKSGIKGNRLLDIYKSGAKVKWDQVRQILAAPILASGPKGAIPIPVTRSYSEGLTESDYWTMAIGARKSVYEKVQEVSVPGALNKQISNLVMDTVVTEKDCKTKHGALVPATDDALDRYTAEPIALKKGAVIPAGTLITPDVLAEIKKAKKSKVLVRTPLRCQASKGVCKKCLGISPTGNDYKVGDNVGVVAAQALGERGVQLSLKQFHSGGSAANKGLLNSIQRVRQILTMPEILPGSAVLARTSGRIDKIEKDPAGGYRVKIRDEEHYIPHGLSLTVKKGDTVEKGSAITTGVINPRELLELTDLQTVQNYLTDALHSIYKQEGVKRIHPEIIVKSLTDLGEVEDPGDHPEFLKGDLTSAQKIQAWNAENKGKKPIKWKPVLKGIDILPLDRTEDWLARLAYRHQGETLQQGAAEQWVSEIHGTHPVPGLVYGAEFGKPKSPEKGPY